MAMMQESSLGQALAEAEPPKGGISDALKKDRYELQCKLLAFVRRSADYDLVGTSVMFGLPRQVLTKLRQCSDQELQRLATFEVPDHAQTAGGRYRGRRTPTIFLLRRL